jgi:hypothetical protein
MPIPSKRKDEDKNKFMSRCMGDNIMNKEYPDGPQRHAVCISKAIEDLSYIEAVGFQIEYKSSSDKKAGYPPNCNEGYVEKDGKCVPVKEESEARYLYENTKTGEVFTYTRKGAHKKGGTLLIYRGKATECQDEE